MFRPIPWCFTSGRSDVFTAPYRCSDIAHLQDEMAAHMAVLIASYPPGGLSYIEREVMRSIVYEVVERDDIGPAVRGIHRTILAVCRHHGVRYVSIGHQDLFCLGGIRYQRWPVAWEVAKSLGINGGCGNGPQYQIRDYLTGWAEELYGIWDTVAVERIDASPLLLRECNREAVEQPIPEGDLPKIDKMRRR